MANEIRYSKELGSIDLTIVAAAYNTRLGDEKWNATADLDKSGLVNILDINMVAEDYGKTV